jgi:succinoglycan biosynthesis protein ExoM
VKHRRGVVGICTFRRPNDLSALLSTLTAILPTEIEGHHFSEIVVVDNDPAASASVVLQEWKRRASIGGVIIHTRNLGRANIADARNEVLRMAEELGYDDLVFLDDDEIPTAEWLAELVGTRMRSSAEMVFGPVIGITPPHAPPWVSTGRFFEYVYAPSEQAVTDGLSGNAMLDLHFVRERHLTFDTTLGKSGGEDQRFFREASRQGALMFFSPKALVHETVPIERCSAKFLLRRYFRTGNALGLHSRDGLKSAATCFAKGGFHVATGGFTMLLHALRRDSVRFRREQFRAARGAGMLLGVIGGRYEFYSTGRKRLTWELRR